MADAHLLTPKGFRAAGVACGIKQAARALDLGLLVADAPATAAAVFTTNKVVAAPVILGRETIRSGRLQAVVVNSGNANACTGEQGMKDAKAMARLTAQAAGIGAEEVLVSSTGVIGHRLPMDKISAGIPHAARELACTDRAAEAFATAIMTTDKSRKVAGRTADIGGRSVCVAGACKGAGMIAPNMATMLAYLTTDAAIDAPALDAALRQAVAVSFNAVTVDGHTSTNDTVLALASGAAGNATITADGSDFRAFAQLLAEVCTKLALMIAADGEGATRVIEVRIEGAATQADADRAARAVADSPLVKCAVHGGDPNWGRVVSAVGYSGATVDPATLRHWIGDVLVFDAGTPTEFDVAAAEAQMKSDRVALRVDLGLGDASSVCYACDLSKEYVTINADYHT